MCTFVIVVFDKWVLYSSRENELGNINVHSAELI